MIAALMLRLAPYKLMLQIAAAALVATLVFSAGWLVNGWRLHSKLSEMEAAHAKEKAEQATAALTTLQADADKIHQAATEFAGIQNTLAPKMVALTKELRNAPKLPADCKPDLVRVRSLDSAIDAANSAIPSIAPLRPPVQPSQNRTRPTTTSGSCGRSICCANTPTVLLAMPRPFRLGPSEGIA